MQPSDPLAKHFRLMAPQTSALRRLGVVSVRDLLYHFPARYESAGSEGRADSLVPGTKVTLIGKLSGLKAKKLWRSRRPATEGWFEDSSGRVRVMWFNQPYIKSYVQENVVIKLTGSVGGKPDRPYISNPEIERSTFDESTKGLFASAESSKLQAPSSLFPVYPESQGVTSRWFYHALQRVFAAGAHKLIQDPIPDSIREKYNLPDLASALVWLHVPEKLSHTESARKRFAFEEIFVIQVARALDRADNDAQKAFPVPEASERADKFVSALTVTPTGAQRRAIAEILSDFDKPHPMARLLEGDVGSGKTLVAAATAYAVVTSRPPERKSGTLQVAYMAPTEILAQQHFESFVNYFRHLPINIALITGSGCKKFPSKVAKDKPTDISRSQLLKWLGNGEIAMLVGTHALIQKKVGFQHLAYAIVDEQHRFGTRQRRALARGKSAERTQNVAEPIDPLLYRDLTYRVRNALFAVKKELGGGHKEIVYQRALADEFTKAGLSFEREKRIPILYRKKTVGTYQPDFVIEDKIIVELKAQTFVGAQEKKQLWTYLKGAEYRLALLANFGPRELTIDRVVYDTARTSASVPQGSASIQHEIPHFLSMTATPIPRTLALTIYGDLDISILDELPPGRAKITTEILQPKERNRAYEKMREELQKGRQAYVICPRINEPDPAKMNALQAKSAKAEAARLQKEIFPEYQVGLLHGGMKPSEKEDAMKDFMTNKIQILVATSVVEVGVNVPNATVILIEGAERFGMAQMHQLRGRVMRSSHPPFCFLLAEHKGETSSKRLRAMEKSDDGFKLAEADLETRGAGDLYGRRQWGVSDIGMDALKNPRLIQAARDEAFKLVAKDSTLADHRALAERAQESTAEMHSE